MIPIYKLDKLPRMQKLRKIAKYFTMAERRLAESNKIDIFTLTELEFFSESAKLLAKDELFSKEARKVFDQSVTAFENLSILNDEPAALLRSLNSIKHLLLTETGKDQADWDFTTVSGVASCGRAFCGRALDSNKRKVFEGMQVYLEDIRSPFNVGAMFRTAESFGVEKIILSPFCADPRHRRAERTAMGCIDIVPWERQELFAPLEKPNVLPNQLLASGQAVFALETGGVPINKFSFPKRGIMIAGSEELGVSPRALEAADASLGRVSIPIYGAKASLNVSTAFGIALQAWASVLSEH